MKKTSVTSILKGTLAAASALFIYALPLGCFIALTLLVVSMEEGSDNLTALTVPLTESMVLLSQGVPFTFGTIRMAIIPLMLTVLLIALIAQCLAKAGPKADVWLSGLLVWVLLNQFCIRFTNLQIHDDAMTIAGKSALVWLLGAALAVIRSGPAVGKLRGLWCKLIPQAARSIMVVAAVVAGGVIALMLLIGLVTVIVWAVNGNAAMVRIFDLINMRTGSRALTSIAYLAWLPNLMVWAISWIAGAGFTVGDLGTFTLWIGQSSKLPPLPLFGILPQSVTDANTRMMLQMCIPVACALVAFAAMLFGPLAIRVAKQADRDEGRRLIFLMVRHALMLCGAAMIILLLSWGAFCVSNGSLGKRHLAGIGVDVVTSMRMVGLGIRQGFITAWLVTSAITALVYALRRLLMSAKKEKEDSSPESDESDSEKISLQTTAREENDDSKSSNQEGTGLGLS